MFILRFFISFLIGYFIYYLSLTWIELLNETYEITLTSFIRKLHHLIELKLPLPCLNMIIICTYLSCICTEKFSVLWQAASVFCFCMCLLLIAYIDMRTMLIPNDCLYVLILLGLPFLFQSLDDTLLQRLLGSIVAAGFMQTVNMVKAESFGLGDIKLMTVCGFYLGFDYIMTAMFLAILSGGIFALYLILGKKAASHSHIAFAPFLCFSIITAIFFGDELMLTYFSLFY